MFTHKSSFGHSTHACLHAYFADVLQKLNVFLEPCLSRTHCHARITLLVGLTTCSLTNLQTTSNKENQKQKKARNCSSNFNIIIPKTTIAQRCHLQCHQIQCETYFCVCPGNIAITSKQLNFEAMACHHLQRQVLSICEDQMLLSLAWLPRPLLQLLLQMVIC